MSSGQWAARSRKPRGKTEGSDDRRAVATALNDVADSIEELQREAAFLNAYAARSPYDAWPRLTAFRTKVSRLANQFDGAVKSFTPAQARNSRVTDIARSIETLRALQPQGLTAGTS